MPAASSIAIAGLALAAVGTATTVIATQRQASAQKKASRERDKLAALEASRQRRRTIREARIARGTALNVAGQVGAGDSSGLAGGLSGLGAQAATNLGFSTQTQAIGKRITGFGTEAAKASTLGAIGGQVAGIGGSIFSNRQAISGAILG